LSGALVVFAKAPRPGKVKTRLCPPLRLEQAAALYACMLDDVLAASAAACAELGLVPILAVDPPEACEALAAGAPAGFRVRAQRGADLAARMEAAVAEVAADGHAPLLLRGSDSPAMGTPALREAVAALAEADLVVAPDPDGGYGLVGLQAPAPGLFDHPMSTSSVLEDTLAHARALGLRYRRLTPGFDVDTIEDIGRLALARREKPTLPCPHTLRYLDEHRIWSLSPDA
jgi:rSAM/selenodomain-associated transferase 1